MNSVAFEFCTAALVARASGALWWPEARLLAVSDMHLGRSDRLARRADILLPPYETRDTLLRLQADIAATDPAIVLCLGDSFDDLAAAQSLTEDERLWLLRLQAARRWLWVEGNHDPGPVDLGGTCLAEFALGGLVFRHIARPDGAGGTPGEISGHYHPKMTVTHRGRSVTRPAFVFDDRRLVLPAYGTYTGGLNARSPALGALLRGGAMAILTGAAAHLVPIDTA